MTTGWESPIIHSTCIIMIQKEQLWLTKQEENVKQTKWKMAIVAFKAFQTGLYQFIRERFRWQWFSRSHTAQVHVYIIAHTLTCERIEWVYYVWIISYNLIIIIAGCVDGDNEHLYLLMKPSSVPYTMIRCLLTHTGDLICV